MRILNKVFARYFLPICVFFSCTIDAGAEDDPLVCRALRLALAGNDKELTETLSTSHENLPAPLRDNIDFLERAARDTSSSMSDIPPSLLNIDRRDPYLKSILRQIEQTAIKNRIERAGTQNIYNTMAAYFNGIVNNTSRILYGQLTAVADLALHIMYLSDRNSIPTVRERTMWFLLSDPRNEETLDESSTRTRSRLARKIARHRGMTLIDNGDRTPEHDPWLALLLYKQARKYLPGNETFTERRILRASAMISKQTRQRAQSMSVVQGDDTTLFGSSQDLYNAILVSLLKKDRATSLHGLQSLDSKRSTPEFTASLDYANALLRFDLHEPEAGLSAFSRIGADFPDTVDGRRGIAAAHSPYTHPLLEYRFERGRARSEKRAHTLLNTPPHNLVFSFRDTQPASLTKTVLRTLAILPFPATIQRWLAAGLSSDYTRQATIDTIAGMIRRFPNDRFSQPFIADFARYYEKARNFQKASYYYALAGELDERKQEELREKEAQNFFDLVKNLDDRNKRKKYLLILSGIYENTEAARKSAMLLEKMERDSPEALNISRNDIYRFPDIQRALARLIPQHLFDGIGSNGEISDKGFTMLPDGTLHAIMEHDGEETVFSGNKDTAERLKNILLETEQIKQSEHAPLKEGGPGIIPFELSGGIGSSGLNALLNLKQYPSDADEFRLFK